MTESAPLQDPRIRRTRQLLHQGLAQLMETKEFEKISVQDIAEAATVNRATFYDHYPDKFALLQCMVGERFQELLAARQVHFEDACSGALVSCVCDFCGQQRRMQPHMESAVIEVIRYIILDGLQRHARTGTTSAEVIATSVSWAIYGAVKEWAQTPNHCPPDEFAKTVVRLVTPMFSV